MKTYIYMVRHGDSPKEGNERTRGLTKKGIIDACRITDILQKEEVHAVISSPYERSIMTVQELAGQIGQKVMVMEDLKEITFSSRDKRIHDNELLPLLKKSFSDPNFTLPGGESDADCQKRSIKVLKEIIKTYRGQKVVIGTHGVVMTLMMKYYDSKYDFEFLLQTSKPDVYKMKFEGEELVEISRIWDLT
ncbi:histidine phosphatase family protein [Oceanobacillus sojae]|uniref:histidine phosphatase family protein n=1 Tax=Oceanobacillus sojae TaxID=582851 RepID=UPI0021A4867B|nr:histidine phosphatase family protein [Oceanobacillus sojae]MCT1902943.1 histidine phosphatase family protein [Oceanobacillus sojae]